LGLLSIFICGLFGLIGLKQWIERKNILNVDHDILCMGIFYAVCIMVYVLFTKVAVNYRPVLENGVLEPSYPSSHTILGICVFASMIIETVRKVKDPSKALIYELSSMGMILLCIVCRFLSGMHWATDIIGGIILSLALICMFLAILPPREKMNYDWADEACEAIKAKAEKE